MILYDPNNNKLLPIVSDCCDATQVAPSDSEQNRKSEEDLLSFDVSDECEKLKFRILIIKNILGLAK
jgi:hypothetical protein